jgi:hypothetical protein
MFPLKLPVLFTQKMATSDDLSCTSTLVAGLELSRLFCGWSLFPSMKSHATGKERKGNRQADIDADARPSQMVHVALQRSGVGKASPRAPLVPSRADADVVGLGRRVHTPEPRRS